MWTNGTGTEADSNHRVAVDVMGGDNGPEVRVEGAVQAFHEFNIESTLVGPESSIKDLLKSFGAEKLPLSIIHAPDAIEMHESPTKAVRRKPESSICLGYHALNDGTADSFISAGNSGAFMAAGRIISGLLTGIERPAIATLIPVAGEGTPNVILDSGANVDCHAHNLVQFAVMGSVYCTCLFGHEKPKVGLLSNGSERTKGTDILKTAAASLESFSSVNYVGYVEGRDIPTDAADVIVCDGFVGNVVLKAMEGSVQLIFNQLLHESKKNLLRKLALLLSKGSYRDVFKEKFDYSAHGGSPLLGLRKLALVLHGSSDVRAVKNAIRVAGDFSKKRMTDEIAAELALLEERMLDLDGSIFPNVVAEGKKPPSKKAKDNKQKLEKQPEGEPK